MIKGITRTSLNKLPLGLAMASQALAQSVISAKVKNVLQDRANIYEKIFFIDLLQILSFQIEFHSGVCFNKLRPVGMASLSVCPRRHGNLQCLLAHDVMATYYCAFVPKILWQLIVPVCQDHKMPWQLIDYCACLPKMPQQLIMLVPKLRRHDNFLYLCA